MSHFVEKEKVIVPKHFDAYPWYHRSENDYFMYSLHAMDKDESQNQFVEEKSTDLMCMLDDFSFMDDLPKYDQYDDDYIKVDSSKQSTTCFWEEEAQLQQLKYDNQPVHINHDSNEENAENSQVSERSFPLCFSSFQFLRGIYKQADQQVFNSRNGEFSDESVEDIICDMEVVLAPESQPLSYIDFQNTDELMQHNFVPLSFDSFQFLKKNVANISEARTGKHIENHVASLEPMQQSSQFLQDPIVDVLDDLCSQSSISFASYELTDRYDKNLIRQPDSWSCSTGVSVQSSSENLHLNQKLYDDVDSICTIPNDDLEFVEFFEYQEIGHVYHDPIAIYMEEFFISGFQLISSASFVSHGFKALCYKSQADNQFQGPLPELVLMIVRNSERAELVDQLLDWLHWHFSIT
jgi:hypothetical protein